MRCRGCDSISLETLIDLGLSPISNDFLSSLQECSTESRYPLHVFVCQDCSLVQLPSDNLPEDLFKEDYLYFSSYSQSWLEHSKAYVESAIRRFGLNTNSKVVEIASNDGYLLQYFKSAGIPVLGIEPAKSVAMASLSKGIPTEIVFFGELTALRLKRESVLADLMIANNVLAHVPNLHDFIKGFSILLKKNGVITFEFPHLYNLITNVQFDTIYHEHYSYLNVTPLIPIFKEYNLHVIDIEQIDTHGGSLRLFVSDLDSSHQVSTRVQNVLDLESSADPRNPQTKKFFCDSVQEIGDNLKAEISLLRKENKKLAAYGAAAKGNTLLNYVGIDCHQISFVVDLNPAKQAKFLPGSHIPVVDLEFLLQNVPDVLLILPWNLTEEIVGQLSGILPKQVSFLRAIPELEYI